LGGWRLIRTLGGKFYKIRPVHGFSTQLTSGLVILMASFFGLPVSTSQVVSSAIIGVGSSERLGKVRWSVAQEIVAAWFITIPASALVAAGIYWLIVFVKRELSSRSLDCLIYGVRILHGILEKENAYEKGCFSSAHPVCDRRNFVVCVRRRCHN
jgi:hypothetical protein